MKTLRGISIVTVFFRVGATITNINIGPLLINHKGYHKNETCSRSYFEFQYEVFSKFCNCLHIKKYFFHSPSSRLAGQTFIITKILIYKPHTTDLTSHFFESMFNAEKPKVCPIVIVHQNSFRPEASEPCRRKCVHVSPEEDIMHQTHRT